MNERSEYYQIEEEIPADRSISGEPAWLPVLSEDGAQFRTEDRSHGAALVRNMLAKGCRVRLVRFAREVVVPEQEG